MVRHFTCRSVPLLITGCFLSGSPSLAVDSHPVVPGFERFFAGRNGDAAKGGQLLLVELNCLSCHRAADALWGRKQAPVLDDVAARVKTRYLREFLLDPQTVKPGTTMPNVFAGDTNKREKVEALVHFLASAGSLKQEPLNAKSASEGRDLYHKVGCVACHGTRDASGNAEKVLSTSVPLGDLKAKYSIPSLAAFLETPRHTRPSGRMPNLIAGKDAKDIAHYLLQCSPITTPNTSNEDTLEIQPALVEKGRILFASTGCANCHNMAVNQKRIASTLNALDLSQLRGEGGCLSASPTAGLPRFALNAAQRNALAVAVKSPAHLSKAPQDVIARTLTTFNCYACHARDRVGRPEDDWNKFFQTTQPEMGDEARVPPPLDGVGAKLNADYLKQVLDRGAHDRPYMHTRMPGFGLGNVGQLVDAFAGDRIKETGVVAFTDSISRVKSAGRHLVGSQGLGCISCHTFAGHKAQGVQGIDMILMPKRLKRDWFHAYLVDPQGVRPGTRMPTAWPNGKSVLVDVLAGDAAAQVEAIWVYLNEGNRAQLPVGLHRQSIPLVPGKNAIIYRNFIQGAGPRGIAVGYPEKIHLAFDANEMRLAMLWQGAFIDAATHWNDRGSGFEGPLGDNVLHLHSGAGFAVLGRPDAAWPTAPPKELGYRFKGYRLTPDDRPTFLYSFGEIQIEDTPNPVAGKELSLRRVLKLTSSKTAHDVYFRAAVGSKIEALGAGWYRIDGWKLKIENGEVPQIRQSAGKAEVIVPVRFTGNKAQILQEFMW
jgi:mono/diheme cytochrome c family protein